MKTEVSIENYNNHDFCSIWELNEKGVRYPKPLISMGKKKLKAVESHLEEMKQLLGLVKDEKTPF